MTATRTARQIVRRAFAAAAFATVAAATVLGGAAGATDFTIRRADLAGSGPTSVLVVSNTGSTLFARVANTGDFWAGSSSASITYQPVSRLTSSTGRTYYVNTPGSAPISATGSVGSISPGSSVQFSAFASSGVPSGLNRITVCADSGGAVGESNESNNCWSEIKTVQADFAN